MKGDEHQVTRVKEKAAIAPEKQASLAEFVDNVVTKQRLEQGINQVFTSQNKVAKLADTGAFLRWVRGDVLKEERDTLEASQLKEEDAGKAVEDAARKWFKTYCTGAAAPAACSSTE